MYSNKVKDHFSNPRSVGVIENAHGVGEAVDSSSGNVIKIFIKIENEVIKDVKFKAFGCAAAIATASMVTELAVGKSLDVALALTKETVAEALDGLPPEKMHCSLLATDALHKAIWNYRGSNT